jgi:hypothetical protein
MIRLLGLVAAVMVAMSFAHVGYLHLVTASSSTTDPSGFAWLDRELALSPAQRRDVRALHEAWWPQCQALRQQFEFERRTARSTGNDAACIAIVDECRACTVTFIRQMAALLTPAQQEKYLSLVAECLPPGSRGKNPASSKQGEFGERPSGR